MKKFLISLLACLCIGTMAVGVSACNFGGGSSDQTSQSQSEGLEYTLSEDSTYYSVTGIGTCTDADVVIPSTYNNLPVQSIGDGAFSSCDSLTSVVIGDSVQSIGASAFRFCTSLTSVVIGDSVQSIGASAFRFCASLTSVEIGDSVQSIGDGAFGNCDSLTSVEIGDSVQSIGDKAFYKCTSLTSVEIGDSVQSIGSFAFEGCTSLTSVEIGDSVQSIGYRAFRYCDSMTDITVDENNIAYKSIDGNLYTKDGTTLIQYAIGKTDTSFTIPDSVQSIGNYAFYECTSLTSVEIGDSVQSIGYMAFYYCSSLTEVYYKGTESDWSAITIGYNYELTTATRYYYSEEQPTESGNYWHYVDGVVTKW